MTLNGESSFSDFLPLLQITKSKCFYLYEFPSIPSSFACAHHLHTTAIQGEIPCNVPPLSLNIMPKACLLVLRFLRLCAFCITALPSPFPPTSLPCALLPLCAGLHPFSLGLHTPPPQNHRLETRFPPAEAVFPLSAYLAPLGCTRCLLACPASDSAHPPLECHPEEASSLWSLSIPSLGEMNTCGLCYQCFNFYQCGVWLMMIHGFRPSIQ